jgi:large subunit ribosomal protein L28
MDKTGLAGRPSSVTMTVPRRGGEGREAGQRPGAATMPRKCPFTGKRTRTGHSISRRGKPKRQGGVGLKITGKTKRKFKANLQRVRAVVNGKVVRIKVSTKAIRSGLIEKPVPRDYTGGEEAAE